MDQDKLTDKLKEEFRDFKATVSSEFASFKLVVEPFNKRMRSLESRQESLEAELKSEITQNTQRIGYLYMDVSKVIENLNRALSKKEMIDDILVRI